MFTPEKMSLVHISCLEEHLIKVMEIIAESEVAHFISVNNISGNNGLEKIDLSNLRSKLSSCMERLERILSAFPTEMKLSLDRQVTISPEEVVERAEKFLSQLEYETSSIITQLDIIDNEVEELDALSWKLSPLEDLEVSIEQLRNTKFLYVEIGTIHGDSYERFVQAIDQMPNFLSIGSLMDGVYPIIVGTPIQHKKGLSAALEAANFSKSEIPEDITGNIEDALQSVEVEIWRRREEKVDLQLELQSIKQERQDMLEWTYTNLIANQTVLEAMENIVETDNTYMIPCYVPSENVDDLEDAIEEDFDNGVLLKASEPVEAYQTKDETNRVSSATVPTKLKHPKFLRPFEILVNNFGYPSYSDIDPTIFAAIGFLAMFGIMFADLGHGAVLFISGLIGGWYLSGSKSLKEITRLIMACGASAMLFGLLFGHTFGKPLIDALWFAPELHEAASINRLLRLGVAVGVVMLSLGVFLNVIRAFRARDFQKAIAGKWGVCSLLFYWTALFIFVYRNYVTQFISQFWVLALLLSAILLPILLWSPVSYLFRKHDEDKGGIGLEIIESSFHLFELVIGYLANTMSYIRVAAFYLSHAGLMVAVYALNEQFEMATWISLPSIVAENIFVIVLEGLIVTIQCLRLEYYEFFSKFFSGSGIKYKPLVLKS